MKLLLPIALMSACKPSLQFPDDGCGLGRRVQDASGSPFNESVETTVLAAFGPNADIQWTSTSNPMPTAWTFEVGPEVQMYTIDDYLPNCEAVTNYRQPEHWVYGTATFSNGSMAMPVDFSIEWVPSDEEPTTGFSGSFNDRPTHRWLTELLGSESYEVPSTGRSFLAVGAGGTVYLGVELWREDADNNQGVPDEAQGTITWTR